MNILLMSEYVSMLLLHQQRHFSVAPTMASVDASNSCIPPSSPLVLSVPPLPSTIRGEPSVLDGRCGRINENSRSLLYASGRLVICRNLIEDTAFCYRGHTSPVTAASFSPSGCYVASADARGKLRVWSYDNEEHLAKLGKSRWDSSCLFAVLLFGFLTLFRSYQDLTALSGPIRGLAWDVDSKRVSKQRSFLPLSLSNVSHAFIITSDCSCGRTFRCIFRLCSSHSMGYGCHMW